MQEKSGTSLFLSVYDFGCIMFSYLLSISSVYWDFEQTQIIFGPVWVFTDELRVYRLDSMDSLATEYTGQRCYGLKRRIMVFMLCKNGFWDNTVFSIVLIQYAGYKAGYVVLQWTMVWFLNSFAVMFWRGFAICYASSHFLFEGIPFS